MFYQSPGYWLTFGVHTSKVNFLPLCDLLLCSQCNWTSLVPRLQQWIFLIVLNLLNRDSLSYVVGLHLDAFHKDSTRVLHLVYYSLIEFRISARNEPDCGVAWLDLWGWPLLNPLCGCHIIVTLIVVVVMLQQIGWGQCMAMFFWVHSYVPISLRVWHIC